MAGRTGGSRKRRLSVYVVTGASICLAAATGAYGATAPDVHGQFAALKHHGEALGFHLGVSEDPTCGQHFQGVARSTGPGSTCLFISHNIGHVAGLLVVEMASRGGDGERLRSNRLKRGAHTDFTLPPTSDRGVANLSFPEYEHAGGIQLVDDVLAVPLEVPSSGASPGRLVLVDVSDPILPQVILEYPLTHKAGFVAFAELAQENCYIFLISGSDSALQDGKMIKLYKTNTNDLHEPNLMIEPAGEWVCSGECRGFKTDIGAYQALNFVEQDDGELLLVGTRRTGWQVSCTCPLDTCEDEADLYHFEYLMGLWQLTYQSTKHFYLHVDWELSGEWFGNFAAAAGIYVSPSGQLILYSIEHENEGFGGMVRMGEFHNHGLNHEGRAGPCTAWLELYDDDHGWTGNDRSLVFDGRDRYLEDLDNLHDHDYFGGKASSAKWCAPVGCSFILYADSLFTGDMVELLGTGVSEEVGDLAVAPWNFGDRTRSVWFEGNCATGTILVPEQFDTVSQGINAVGTSPCDSVSIRVGIYPETMTIEKQATITSRDGTATIGQER